MTKTSVGEVLLSTGGPVPGGMGVGCDASPVGRFSIGGEATGARGR